MSLSASSMAVDYFGNSRWLEWPAEDGIECEHEKIYKWCIGGIGAPCVLSLIVHHRPPSSVGPSLFFCPRPRHLPTRTLPEFDQPPFQFGLDRVALACKRLNPHTIIRQPLIKAMLGM